MKQYRFYIASDTHGKLPEVHKGQFDFVCVPGDIAPHFKKNWSYSDYFERMVNVKDEAADQKQWAKDVLLPWTKEFDCHNSIVINGNHDFADYSDLFENYTYMEPKTKIIDGIKFGFLPGTNWLANEWNDEIHEDEFDRRINMIDRDIEVLISHQPPSQILDLTYSGQRIGSHAIYKAIFGLRGLEPYFNKLKLHMFGHVHDESQIMVEHEIESRKVIFINAACKIKILNIELGS